MPNPTPAARRRWQATLIISLFFVAVAASAGIGWWYARESPPHQGPIVVISVEAMQARRLHAYDATANATPAIDALAADGVMFTRAYAHSPQTLPAHASLLTGQLPFEHGVRDDAGFVLAGDARTLAEQLRNRGFATGAAVSSFLLRRESGAAQGFSFFDGDMPAHEPAAPPAIERDGLATSAIAEQWMRTQDGQRYFLFLEVNDGAADAAVSRVVQLLKDRDLYDDSTIVLTAAHGEQSARAWLDDRSLAIPLIVKQPDGEGAGRHVATPVQQIDIMPTLLDVVRAPIPGGLRGRSLRPILDSEDGTVAPQPLYAEALAPAWRFGGTPVYSLTQDGYRLTRAGSDTVARVDDSVPVDPAEQSRAARLAAVLDRLLANRPVPMPADVAPADRHAFAAAGYLPGLRIIQPPPAAIDQAEQVAIADAHSTAARLFGASDYAGALNALQTLARKRPDLAPVQFQIGSILAKTGRLAEAIAAFLTAAMLRPDDPDVATAMARTHLRARQMAEAKTRASDAVALAEKSALPALMADAYEAATRVALVEPDAEAAEMYAQQAEKANPSRPLTAFVRGRVAYDEGKFDEALTAFQEAVKVTRDRQRELPDLHLHLGDTLARLDRTPEAEMEYREELRLFPENLQTYASLVALSRAQDQPDAAEQTIAELLTAAPTPEGTALATVLRGGRPAAR